MKRETIQRVATPTAILVGLDDALAVMCTDLLADGGLRVLRVGHVAAASERIPVVMPQLVLTSTTLSDEDTETLADRCVAVGAEVLKLAPGTDPEALRPMLKNAAQTALIRSLRGAR
ncbi:MAG: hypothetical protein KF819_04865 [Labilithrix sp.]|nr:hypothetical protein [Labilithrix sp.]